MNRSEASKTVADLGTADTATNATSQTSIDTLGFSYAAVDVIFEKVAAAGTNSAVAIACKLQHGDTTSSYSDIVAFTGGTATSATVGYTIPTPGNTADTNVVRFNVDLRGKRRYLNVFATPQVASVVAVNCRLSKGVNAPVSASEAGVKAFASG